MDEYAFRVAMESAKSATEDLKAIMDSVKSINKEKQEWREEAAGVAHQNVDLTHLFKKKDDDD